MCTVSWCWQAGGYELFFNRDERHERAVAEPPSVDPRRELPVLSPRDGDHGGSWLTVNAAGVTIGILNHYPARLPTVPSRSRGLLVQDLATGSSVAKVRTALEARDLHAYSPFTILVLGLEMQGHAATWDGQRLHPHPSLAPPLTSSSYCTADVITSRLAQYASLARGPELSSSALDAFHRSHVPVKGPYAVCMHRADARTVSYSRVRVSGRFAQFEYHADSPCADAPAATASLTLDASLAS